MMRQHVVAMALVLAIPGIVSVIVDSLVIVVILPRVLVNPYVVTKEHVQREVRYVNVRKKMEMLTVHQV